MTKKLVIFDFDGTLFDSQPQFDIAIAEFSKSKSLPYDCYKIQIGYVDPLKYDLGWGIPLDQQPALFEELANYTKKQLLDHQRFMPEIFSGIHEVLAILAAQYDLGIVTARDRDTLMIILKHYKMDHYFPHLRTFCCANERGYGLKPLPDALNCLLHDTKHHVDDVIVIGDTTSDILMANAAGVKSIAVHWGLHPHEKLASANPTVMLEKVSDMPLAIDRLFTR